MSRYEWTQDSATKNSFFAQLYTYYRVNDDDTRTAMAWVTINRSTTEVEAWTGLDNTYVMPSIMRFIEDIVALRSTT